MPEVGFNGYQPGVASSTRRAFFDIQRVLASVVGGEWKAITLINSWANIGAPWHPAEYRVINGEVVLRGRITAGSGVDSIIWDSIPVALRPAAHESFTVWVADTGNTVRVAARLDVLSSGSLQLATTFGPSTAAITTPVDSLSLSGIRWAVP